MKCIKYAGAVALLACAISCSKPADSDTRRTDGENKPMRVGMVTGLDREKAAYYKELHANTWEGVLKKLKECNVRNYSIYLHEIEGKYFLFSYYEYVGDDYEADMKRIAADTTTQHWWKETDPCQIPLPEAAAEHKIWAEMEEVFHMD